MTSATDDQLALGDCGALLDCGLDLTRKHFDHVDTRRIVFDKDTGIVTIDGQALGYTVAEQGPTIEPPDAGFPYVVEIPILFLADTVELRSNATP